MKAKTHLSQNKSRGGFTLVEMLVVISMIAALAGISFPVYKGIQKKVEKQALAMMFNAVDIAVDNFETEYNHLPFAGDDYPTIVDWYRDSDGTVNEITTILAGEGVNCNFKNIKFLEWSPPKGSAGNYTDGLLISGGTATLYDPWGGEIGRMRFDHDLTGSIRRPWGDANVPADYIHKKVIFYSFGADGLQSSGGNGPEMADNVYNWEDEWMKSNF